MRINIPPTLTGQYQENYNYSDDVAGQAEVIVYFGNAEIVRLPARSVERYHYGSWDEATTEIVEETIAAWLIERLVGEG